MTRQIINFFLFLVCSSATAQQYIAKDGLISFFSKAPIEDISAVNNNVSAVYDSSTGEIIFQLKIKDFVFPKKLMQEHFNENYLESDIYPTSLFQGKVIDPETYIQRDNNTKVIGNLNIHGETNSITVEGKLIKRKDIVTIKADFSIKLEDYNIDIPKIVMYNIAEIIDVHVEIELNKVL